MTQQQPTATVRELGYGLIRLTYRGVAWFWWIAALALVAVLAAVAVIAHVVSPAHPTAAPTPPSLTTLSVAATTTAVPSTGSPAATATVTPPTTAVVRVDPAVAVTFVTRWGHPGPGWLASLAPYTTPRLLRLLATTRPENQPALRVTGYADYVTSADGMVEVVVPAAPHHAVVTLTRVKGLWLVDQIAVL